MKTSIIKSLILSGLLCSTFAVADSQHTANKGVVDTSVVFNRISTLWVGDFNNDEQIAELKRQNKPILSADGSGKGGHLEIQAHYRLLDLPDLSPLVLYVEETKHGDPKAIFRQRVYTFSHDEKNNEVRLTLWTFKDKERYVGAWKKPSILRDIDSSAIKPMPDGCDLILNPDGEGYHFVMEEKACSYGDKYFSYQARIQPGEYWFRDKIVSLSTGEVLETAGNYSYHKLIKQPSAMKPKVF
jgi:hypothetical protein